MTNDSVGLFKALGGEFSPNMEEWIAGTAALICVLCRKGPCVCRPCQVCKWNGAPDHCQICDKP